MHAIILEMIELQELKLFRKFCLPFLGWKAIGLDALTFAMTSRLRSIDCRRGSISAGSPSEKDNVPNHTTSFSLGSSDCWQLPKRLFSPTLSV